MEGGLGRGRGRPKEVSERETAKVLVDVNYDTDHLTAILFLPNHHFADHLSAAELW